MIFFALLQYILYAAAPLAAILTYFHIMGKKEQEEAINNKFNDEYHPEITDCKAKLHFCKTGVKEKTLKTGLEYLLIQSAPTCVTKLFHSLGQMIGISNTKEHAEDTEEIEFDVLDARVHKPGAFEETGFTLITLDKEPVTQNWAYGSNDVHLFKEQIEPYLKRLYPQTKKIRWFSNLVRGGSKAGSQPRALGPHLDYFQGDEEREEFHKKYTALKSSEPEALLGRLDTEEEKLGVLLGIWKPLYPKEIMDYPLAVMDARTFSEENEVPNNLHMNFGLFTFHNLGAAISHDPKQKWYYYSKQNTKEVLVFHQYTKGKWFSNPHTSFLNKNCPKGTELEERISAELRVGLYF